MFGPGADQPILWDEGSAMDCSGTHVYQADERGSIIASANCSGNLTHVYRYDEYGIPQSWDGSALIAANGARFGYTGQVWLPELGLYYYKARMYSPTLGRFMQTDPIGYGDGMNMYRYAHNDPVNGTDPTGLDGCPTSSQGSIMQGAGTPTGEVPENCTTLHGGGLGGETVPTVDGPYPTELMDPFGNLYHYERNGSDAYTVNDSIDFSPYESGPIYNMNPFPVGATGGSAGIYSPSQQQSPQNANKPCGFWHAVSQNKQALIGDTVGFAASFLPIGKPAVALAGLAIGAGVLTNTAATAGKGRPALSIGALSLGIVGIHLTSAGPLAETLEATSTIVKNLPVTGQILAGASLALDAINVYEDYTPCGSN